MAKRGSRYIYIFQRPGLGVKIGISFSPEKRLAEICGAAGSKDITLFCALPVLPMLAAEIEAHAHQALRIKRGIGEWFAVAPIYALAAIQEAIAHVSTMSGGFKNNPISLADRGGLLNSISVAVVADSHKKFSEGEAAMSAERARAAARKLGELSRAKRLADKEQARADR